MKKIIITSFVLAGCMYGRTQVTVKKDVIAYFRQLPPPPATLADAYANCHCVSAAGVVSSGGAGGTGVAVGVHESVTADLQSMGTITNTEAQQVQQATVLHNQAVTDNVSGMNKNQQLSWVQNTMQGYGNASGQSAFAQKMQDPAEKAKFMAMTPDQKLAYMKGVGLDPMKGAPAAQKASSPVALAQGCQLQMQNQLIKPQADPWSATLQQMLAENWQGGAGDAQKRLIIMDDNYRKLLAFYIHTDSAYGVAMTTANYGYTGDSGQDDAVSKLSAGQYLILNQVAQLEAFLNGIYQFGAAQQAKVLKAK